MATTEEFLVQIGLDPASVSRLISAVQQAKTQAEGVTIDLTVTSNAAAVAGEVGAAAQQAGMEADQAMAIFEDGIRDASNALGELKKGMLAISAIAVAIGGFGFTQATKESEAYARANVILGFSLEELKKVQEELRGVADETSQSYVNVAESLFQVASAGFTGQAALDAVTAASRAAVPAGIETGVAFDAIATAMTNFGVSADDAADKLVRIADLTRGTLGDVSGAMGLIGPVAADLGISLDEVGAAFAQITVQTGRAEIASTLLFNAILTFLSPAKEAEDALRGISVTTGAAAFTTQTFAEKLLILKTAAAEGRVEIAKVFNRRALRGIQPLINSLDDYNEKLEQIADSTGRTAEGSKVFFASAGPQWTALTTAIKNAATAIGTDLLETLVPAIQSTRDFVIENRTLIKWLGKAGLVLAALTGTYIAYRLIMAQVRAATLLVTGVTKALTAALTFESASLATNVKAWAVKLTAEQAASASPVIIFLRRLIAVLAVETGVVLASAKAWIVRSVTGILKALALIPTAIALTVAMIRQIVLETAAIWSNTAARRAQIPTMIAGQGAVRALSNALRANVMQMSAAGVAAGALGAFIAGWKIGKAVNEWLQLDKATHAFVRGTATGMQKAKAAIVGALIPAVGLATLYYKNKADATRAAARVLTGPMKKALAETAGAQEKYNFWVNRGLHETQAFGIALGNLRTELTVLNALEEEGKATTEDLARRSEIVLLLAKRNREIAEQSKRVLDLQRAIHNSQAVINQTSEEWLKLVKRVEGAYRELQTGPLSKSLVDLEGFDKDFDLILKRLVSFNAELSKLEAKRARLTTEGAAASDLQQNADAIEEVTKRIEDVQRIFSQQIALIQNRIVANARTFVSDLRSEGQERLRLATELSDKEIAVEKRKVDEIIKEIGRLKAARDKSIQATEQFIERLEEAELRRRDTNLADIIRLEKEFNRAIKEGIDTEERRVRILKALREELERLAAPAEKELRLQRALQETRKQIAALSPEEDQEGARERANQLIEKQKDLTDELAAAEEKRGVRRAEAEAALARASEASVTALEAFSTREKALEDLGKQRKTLEENIKTIRENVKQIEIDINKEVEDQVKRVGEVAGKQLEVLKHAQAYVKLLREMRDAEPAAFKAAIGGAQQRMESAIKEVQDLGAQPIGEEALPLEQLREIIDGSRAVADWMVRLKENLTTVSTTLTAQKDAIIPAAENVTQTFSDLADVFEPSGNAVARMLEATQQFAPKVESFSEEVANKMDAAARRMEQATSRIGQVERRVAALETAPAGGANGLPE